MASGFRGIHLSRNGMLALVTVVGILTIGILVFFIVREGDDEPEKKENTATEAPPRPSRTPNQPPPGQHAANTEEQPPYPVADAQQIAIVTNNAKGFVTAWVDDGTPKARWFAEVKVYCTKRFADSLSTVDPAISVPATNLAGEPRDVSVGNGFAKATVPVNSGTVTLTFRYLDDKWLVDEYSFDRRLS